MNCRYCNGVNTKEHRKTRFCAYDIPNPFVMENVPALVCNLCGDKTYSGDAVKALKKSKTAKRKPAAAKPFKFSISTN